jgi:ADP-ribose pyrophosphatase
VAADEPKVRRVRVRELHRGSIGVIGVHDVALPSGEQIELVLIQHPGAIAVVPFLDRDRIVLLRHYRYAAGGVIWEVPAGKLDGGEAPERCAARELEEETGYRAGRIVRTGRILTTPGFTDEVIHLFCAFDLSPGPTAHEPGELIEVREVRFDEAIEMVERGELIDAKSVAALHHAQRLRATGATAPGFP